MLIDIVKIEEFKNECKDKGIELANWLREVPEWFERLSFESATVSFEDMVGKPVTVFIRDCTQAMDDRIQQVWKKKQNDDALDSELISAMSRAHIERIEGDEDFVIFPERPGENDKDNKWQSWAEKLRSKVAARLFAGMSLARQDAGAAEGN